MFTRCCGQESHVHRLTSYDVDRMPRQKSIGSVPDPFGAGAYTASDKALRGKSGLVHETNNTHLVLVPSAFFLARLVLVVFFSL